MVPCPPASLILNDRVDLRAKFWAVGQHCWSVPAHMALAVISSYDGLAC